MFKSKIFLLGLLFALVGAPDVPPPEEINTEAPTSTTTTTTTTTTEMSQTTLEPKEPESSEFICPLNCTCSESRPQNPCCPIGFYFNTCWNMCLVKQAPRFYRNTMQQYANNKYRACNNGFSFCQGKCVKKDANVMIYCPFPQKELPCCHIEFPKKCKKSEWGENCFITTYYYCGDMCARKDNLSETDLNTLINYQIKQQQRWQSAGEIPDFQKNFGNQHSYNPYVNRFYGKK